MRTLLESLIGRLEQNESVVMGVIVRSTGSVPRASGARMLVCEDGSLLGTVGGGMVEGACREKAVGLFRSDHLHAMADFHMNAAEAAADGMVCGGSVTVLLQKVTPDSLDIFNRLSAACKRGESPSLITGLPNGTDEPYVTVADNANSFRLPASVVEAIGGKKSREPFVLNDRGRELLVEPLVHPGTVHLVGAGHVALATAQLAAFAGFDVVVLDDREEFANRERYPEAREINVLDSFDNCIGGMGPEDYVVIVTRGHMHDRDVLTQALRTDAGYIGMIGSSRKRRAVYDSLLDNGFTEADLERVFSPIGLPIGADTPEEIGVSIVAELIKVRAGRRR